MTGGRSPARKGHRIELEAVHLLQSHGIAAERIPLSGSAGGRFGGDVTAPVLGLDRIFEVKCRASGFASLYRWIDGRYGVIMRADRQVPLVVLRLDDFAALAIAADRCRLAPLDAAIADAE